MEVKIKQRIEQIRKGEVPEGYKKTKVGIVPKEWEESHLSNYLVVSSEKNTKLKYTKKDVFSISGELGIVNQIELLGRSYAGASVAPYGIVYPNDIVYTKSPLKANPYGIIKTNKTGKVGLVSTLYAVFHCKDNVSPNFVQYYFELDQNLNNYLYPIVNIGAKHDMKISDENSLRGWVVFPSLSEQKKIAEILSTQDKLIELKEKLIEEKKRQKKYLMQQLLTGKKRLHGFSNKWINVKLGDVFAERVETNCQDLDLLSITGTQGIILRSQVETKDNSSEDKSKYLKICKGDIGYNTMRMWQGVSALSKLEGIVSPAYTILIPSKEISAKYFSYLFKMHYAIFLFYRFSQGIVDDTRSLKYREFAKLHLYVPSDKVEQNAIAELLDTVDKEIYLLQKNLNHEKQKKKALMQLLLTGIARITL